MSYLETVTVGSFAISLLAVSIAIHTKLQQKESRELRELAEELNGIEESIKKRVNDSMNPLEDRDISLHIEELGREAVTCSHETGSTIVDVFIDIKHLYRENGELDKEDIDNANELASLYKNNETINIHISIGNLDKMYSTGRNIEFYNPMIYAATISSNINEIENKYGDHINNFDSDIFERIEDHLNEITKQSSENIVRRNNSFTLDVSDFDTTEEIGEYVFEKLAYYDNFEEDIKRLKELQEELEDIRKAILQASYS